MDNQSRDSHVVNTAAGRLMVVLCNLPIYIRTGPGRPAVALQRPIGSKDYPRTREKVSQQCGTHFLESQGQRSEDKRVHGWTPLAGTNSKQPTHGQPVSLLAHCQHCSKGIEGNFCDLPASPCEVVNPILADNVPEGCAIRVVQGAGVIDVQAVLRSHSILRKETYSEEAQEESRDISRASLQTRHAARPQRRSRKRVRRSQPSPRVPTVPSPQSPAETTAPSYLETTSSPPHSQSPIQRPASHPHEPLAQAPTQTVANT